MCVGCWGCRDIPQSRDAGCLVGWRHKACAGTHQVIAYPPQQNATRFINNVLIEECSYWWVGYFDVWTVRVTMTPYSASTMTAPYEKIVFAQIAP